MEGVAAVVRAFLRWLAGLLWVRRGPVALPSGPGTAPLEPSEGLFGPYRTPAAPLELDTGDPSRPRAATEIVPPYRYAVDHRNREMPDPYDGISLEPVSPLATAHVRYVLPVPPVPDVSDVPPPEPAPPPPRTLSQLQWDAAWQPLPKKPRPPRPDCWHCGASYRVVDERGHGTGIRHCESCGKERYIEAEDNRSTLSAQRNEDWMQELAAGPPAARTRLPGRARRA